MVRLAVVLSLVAACAYDAPPELAGPADAPGDVTDVPPDTPPERAGTPIALWRFDEISGITIADAVPGTPITLTLVPTSTVTHPPGGLRLEARSMAVSPATPHVNQKVRTSGAATLEAWVTPANATQGAADYAQVAAISVGLTLRNISIEQRGGVWAGRVRTAETTTNGEPLILTTAAVDTIQPTHLVLVADGASRVLYVDGVAFESIPAASGVATNWDPNMKIRLGDEDGTNRAWLGTLWLVAMYDEALTAGQVMQNFRAGHDCSGC